MVFFLISEENESRSMIDPSCVNDPRLLELKKARYGTF